jgi:imidazolonepropionase
VNAACSLDLQHEVGSIEPGKRADLVLLRAARFIDLVRVEAPAIRAVVKDGRVVVEDGRLVAPSPARWPAAPASVSAPSPKAARG